MPDPIVIWIGLFTLGMLTGRSRLELQRTAAPMAVGGVAATLLFGATAKVLADGRIGEVHGNGHLSEPEAGSGAEETLEPGSVESDVDDITDVELGALIRQQKAGTGDFAEPEQFDSSGTERQIE